MQIKWSLQKTFVVDQLHEQPIPVQNQHRVLFGIFQAFGDQAQQLTPL